MLLSFNQVSTLEKVLNNVHWAGGGFELVEVGLGATF